MPVNKNRLVIATLLLLSNLPWLSYAASEEEAITHCLLEAVLNSHSDRRVSSIKSSCKKKLAIQKVPSAEELAKSRLKRIQAARSNAPEFEPFSIIPHRRNYILPVYYTSNINRQAYTSQEDWPNALHSVESKYQLSLKVPIHENVMRQGDSFNIAFTVEAWWQTYSESISRPFRETNYRPEFFYNTPIKFKPWGYDTDISFGFEHQSNGRDLPLSRSWNRLFTEITFQKDNHKYFVRPWYRIPESPMEDENDVRGDENPNIHKYMGYFEAGGATHSNAGYEINYMFRANPATGKGALEMGFSFPLWGKVRGYTQLFHGYGESMIDYDHEQTRIGIGFALSDLL